MAAVTDVQDWITGNNGMQLITCVATDGETFASKFSSIKFVYAQSRSRTGSYCSVSGGVVTYNCSLASDDTVDMLVFGN